MKYRLGRKHKRAILDETGHEVAIFHKKYADKAQVVVDILNVVDKNVFSDIYLLKDGDVIEIGDEFLPDRCDGRWLSTRMVGMKYNKEDFYPHRRRI